MKIATDTALIVSTMGDDEQRMGFDEEGAAHLMMLLSTVYSASAEAVLREYANNARDSHIAAGVDAPVEISLPSEFDSTLIVIDHGLGLSREEVRSIFATYGRSTKRESSDQVGAFGIGSKSAFTLGSQFSVTSTKNGRRTVALCSLNEREEPTTTILDESDTDEANGVTVAIPVSPEQSRAMRDAVPKVFGMWPSSTVLVDGDEPPHLEPKLSTEHGFFLDPASSVGLSSVAVEMGGSLYTVPDSIIWGVVAGYTRRVYLRDVFVARVPMDSVHLVPTREAVRDTAMTRRAITQAVEATISELTKRARAYTDLPTPAERAALHLAMSRLDLAGPYKELPKRDQDWSALDGDPAAGRCDTYDANDVRKSLTKKMRLRRLSSPSLDAVEGLVIITGAPETASARTVMRKWLHITDREGISQIVLTPAETATVMGLVVSPDDPSGLTVLRYSDLVEQTRSVRLPTHSRTRTEPSYPVYYGACSRHEFPASIIASDLTVSMVVVNGERQLAKTLEDAGDLDLAGVVFADVMHPRSEGAFLTRLEQAGFSGRVMTGTQFTSEVINPVLERYVDEALIPQYTRPHLVVEVMRRLDDLVPAVREVFETHPFTARDSVPKRGIIKAVGFRVLSLAQEQGRSTRTVSWDDLCLGSAILRRSLTGWTSTYRRDDFEMRDVIAILNSRADRARELLADAHPDLAA